MHTYIDFLTHIKGVEYILSVVTIAGLILFLEILKPEPFRTLIRSTREDLDFLRETGARETARTVKRILAAPFIGLAYVIMMPFLFAYALGTEAYRTAREGWERALDLAGRTAFFGWRPMEAYFGGKRRKSKKKGKGKKEETEAEKGE